jgi:type VI secretion system protein ImpA
MSAIVDRDPDPKKDATAKLAAWRDAIPPSPRDESLGAVDIAMAALEQLESAVEAHAPGEGPSLTMVREALRDVVVAIEQPVGRGAPATNETTGSRACASLPAVDDDTHAIRSAAPARQGVGSNRPNSREDALRCLRDVAGFFRQTEPHSPVAYLAEKAARWGEMPLHEWLSQVLGDGEALTRLRDVLDVRGEPIKK